MRVPATAGLTELAGLQEIERLRSALSACLWAAVSERYGLPGLRAFVRSEASRALRLDEPPAPLPSSDGRLDAALAYSVDTYNRPAERRPAARARRPR